MNPATTDNRPADNSLHRSRLSHVVTAPLLASSRDLPAISKGTDGSTRTHPIGCLCLGYNRATALVPAMTEVAISAPAGPFLAGLGRVLVYTLEAGGVPVPLAFPPSSVGHRDPYQN